MKNISELLDTKQEIAVWMMLNPIIENGPPWVKVYVNGRLLHAAHMIEGTIIMSCIPVLEPVDIRVEMSGKNYSDKLETAVVVEEFMLDNIRILPDYTHCITYTNDHNNTTPTHYLGFNGVWEFKTDVPFYQWNHRVSGQGWLLEP